MTATIVISLVCLVIAGALIVVYLLFGREEARFTMDIGGGAPRAAGGSDTSAETGFKKRLTGLNVFVGSILALLLGKLWSMQLVSADEYSELAESNRTRTITTLAARGRILDRNGEELVSNRPSHTVVAYSDVIDDTIEMRLLGNLIGMPAMAVKRKIQDETQGAQNSRVVAVDVSRRVVAFIQERPYLFENVSVEERSQRFYPNGSLAAHVLGYTGSVTTDQIEEQEEDASQSAITYEYGDTVGQSGVEYQYESILQGVRGEQDVYVDADGNVLSYSTSVDARSGSDIELTIDLAIQTAAEKGLAYGIEMAKRAGSDDCDAGSVVVMDVTNGEILAMASAPTYSPNIFIGGISNDDWESLSSDESSNPLINRAIAGLYPSASTIKPICTFAALENDIIDLSTTFDCQGWWTGFGEGSGQWCWEKEGHGVLGLEDAITFSCDVYFYEVGKAFYEADNNEGIQDMYKRWGLGSLTGIDLPSEAEGRVPTPEWKWEYFSSYSDLDRSWKGGDNTNLCIGQGDLLVTPLQMCCAYAGISTSGTVMRPHILKSVRPAEGEGSVMEHKTEVLNQIDLDSKFTDAVHEGLKGVIYDENESQAAHFTNMSETLAGKTGTAEMSEGSATGWFIVYVPYDNPKYAVASCIEHGGYGAQCALYAVRETLAGIYDEPDSSSVEVSNSDG